MWDDFIQEEIIRGSKSAGQHDGYDEDNVALSAKGDKKSKKVSKGGAKQKGEGKKDMSKVKCFACHKMGHYAGQCPKKKNKQLEASAEVEFSTKFKEEFYLLVCLSSSAASKSVWYIDIGLPAIGQVCVSTLNRLLIRM